MSVNWNKPLRTKGHKYPVTYHYPLKNRDRVIVVVDKGCGEYYDEYTPEGEYFRSRLSEYDLENVPEEKVLGVVNVYQDHTCGSLVFSKEEAEKRRVGGLGHVVTITECDGEVKATVEKVK